jgi:serine/threonine protein kinase
MAHFVQDSNAITTGDQYQRGRYTMIRQLAKGGQGIVILVKDNTDNVEYDVEWIFLTHLTSEQINRSQFWSHFKRRVLKMIDEDLEDNIIGEIRMLQELKNKSRHIIEYIEDFQFTAFKRCIITEYCPNGDLDMIIQKYKAKNEPIPIHKLTFWVVEILEGIAFLHKKNIIHRDIKPQ